MLLERAPDLPQAACFDTAFHRTNPDLAQRFALPVELHDSGIRRYGFHGLSYEYIASVLPAIDADAASGRCIVLHLGNGASMCALLDGSGRLSHHQQLTLMDAETIIAKRIARELSSGILVNLGVGIPPLVANHVPAGISVFFQSANGLIGTGPAPGKLVPSMGGAMDLVTGARRVVAAMRHSAKGRSRVVNECTLPLTSTRLVKMAVTELAVIDFELGHAQLRETAPGISVDEVLAATEAEPDVPAQVSAMSL